MFTKKYIRNNIIAFAILSILLSIFGFAGVGMAALLIAPVNLLAGVICLLMKQKTNGLTLLLCGGVLLLIGFSICSTATIGFQVAKR